MDRIHDSEPTATDTRGSATASARSLPAPAVSSVTALTPPGQILRLQATIGNQATLALLKSRMSAPTSTSGQPGAMGLVQRMRRPRRAENHKRKSKTPKGQLTNTGESDSETDAPGFEEYGHDVDAAGRRVENRTKSAGLGAAVNNRLPGTADALKAAREQLGADAKLIVKAHETKNVVDPTNAATAAAASTSAPTMGPGAGKLTIVLAVVEAPEVGGLRKFAFTNLDNMPLDATAQAEKLGYHVIRAPRAHAEGQLVQYLESRAGVYELKAMGCDKDHCPECFAIMKDQYSDFETRTEGKERPKRKGGAKGYASGFEAASEKYEMSELLMGATGRSVRPAFNRQATPELVQKARARRNAAKMRFTNVVAIVHPAIADAVKKKTPPDSGHAEPTPGKSEAAKEARQREAAAFAAEARAYNSLTERALQAMRKKIADNMKPSGPS